MTLDTQIEATKPVTAEGICSTLKKYAKLLCYCNSYHFHVKCQWGPERPRRIRASWRFLLLGRNQVHLRGALCWRSLSTYKRENIGGGGGSQFLEGRVPNKTPPGSPERIHFFIWNNFFDGYVTIFSNRKKKTLVSVGVLIFRLWK